MGPSQSPRRSGRTVLRRAIILVLGGALAAGRPGRLAAQGPDLPVAATSSLPPWAAASLGEREIRDRLDLLMTRNPFVVTGDFDGDGRLDVAVAVRDRASGKRGILILSRARRPVLLGAGTAFGNGGDDFDWLDAWRTDELGADRPPAARGRFAIHVEKMDAASAWIYWDGRRYRWHQLGD